MVKMQLLVVFTGMLVLLLVLGTSTTNADDCCIPHEHSYWIFPRRTDTDAVVLSNAVLYDLDAFTLCMFFRDDPDEESSDSNAPFSYATPNSDNTLTFITSPSIRMLIAGVRIDTELTINDSNWHQICFTWESANGHYQLYMNGELKAEGDSGAEGAIITSGGTAVLGQEQDNVGGGFIQQQAFVGQLAQVNLWGTVLSESDIVAQRNHCHIPDGSVIRSEDFINRAEVRGGAQVVCG